MYLQMPAWRWPTEHVGNRLQRAKENADRVLSRLRSAWWTTQLDSEVPLSHCTPTHPEPRPLSFVYRSARPLSLHPDPWQCELQRCVPRGFPHWLPAPGYFLEDILKSICSSPEVLRGVVPAVVVT